MSMPDKTIRPCFDDRPAVTGPPPTPGPVDARRGRAHLRARWSSRVDDAARRDADAPPGNCTGHTPMWCCPGWRAAPARCTCRPQRPRRCAKERPYRRGSETRWRRSRRSTSSCCPEERWAEWPWSPRRWRWWPTWLSPRWRPAVRGNAQDHRDPSGAAGDDLPPPVVDGPGAREHRVDRPPVCAGRRGRPAGLAARRRWR